MCLFSVFWVYVGVWVVCGVDFGVSSLRALCWVCVSPPCSRNFLSSVPVGGEATGHRTNAQWQSDYQVQTLQLGCQLVVVVSTGLLSLLKTMQEVDDLCYFPSHPEFFHLFLTCLCSSCCFLPHSLSIPRSTSVSIYSRCPPSPGIPVISITILYPFPTLPFCRCHSVPLLLSNTPTILQNQNCPFSFTPIQWVQFAPSAFPLPTSTHQDTASSPATYLPIHPQPSDIFPP